MPRMRKISGRLPNYDRFKGSRKANVEVHGGATLEEVTVPIIEISYLNDAVEVKIMPIDSTATLRVSPKFSLVSARKLPLKYFLRKSWWMSAS